MDALQTAVAFMFVGFVCWTACLFALRAMIANKQRRQVKALPIVTFLLCGIASAAFIMTATKTFATELNQWFYVFALAYALLFLVSLRAAAKRLELL